MIVCIIPISIIVGVVHLIIKKTQLRQARFYIIANLSVADTLTLLVICIGAIKGLYEVTTLKKTQRAFLMLRREYSE